MGWRLMKVLPDWGPGYTSLFPTVLLSSEVTANGPGCCFSKILHMLVVRYVSGAIPLPHI